MVPGGCRIYAIRLEFFFVLLLTNVAAPTQHGIARPFTIAVGKQIFINMLNAFIEATDRRHKLHEEKLKREQKTWAKLKADQPQFSVTSCGGLTG